ncbi:MAG: enoyl-CoA hydratase [Pseudomonadota bacterium]
MTEPPVSFERAEGVATIALQRPEALNALSLAVEGALRAAFRSVEDDPTIRAVVLTGEGRAFSVGVDLKELGASPEGLSDRVWHGPGSVAQAMRSCSKPIIGAINGFAVTGGLELALQCDFLIASEAAKFADTHSRVGITPSWGMTQILPRLIGPARARQMSLTGAYIDAATACAWGLVNEVTGADYLMPRAHAIAREIAETDPISSRKIHRLIEEGLDHPLPEALAMEAAVFDDHIATFTHEMIEENRRRVQARGKQVAGGGA